MDSIIPYQKDPNEPEETDYTYSMTMGGLQYTHRIGESQFFWTSSLGVGNAKAEIEPRYSVYPDVHESGLCGAVWTGFLLEATQRVSLYLEAGYHKATFSNELEDASVGGPQVLFGIRITIWGKNRGLFSGTTEPAVSSKSQDKADIVEGKTDQPGYGQIVNH